MSSGSLLTTFSLGFLGTFFYTFPYFLCIVYEFMYSYEVFLTIVFVKRSLFFYLINKQINKMFITQSKESKFCILFCFALLCFILYYFIFHFNNIQLL